MILVTGATGSVGGAVLKELVSRGVKPLRAIIRSEKDRSTLPAGVEAVIGDFAKPQTLSAALTGVDSAFLVCSPMPDLVQLETNFLHACQAAKTKHVVINSALGAGDFPKSFPSWHRQVEDAARKLGLATTIFRPNGFMQNIATYFAPTIRTQDAFYGTIGDAKISLIDLRDIAAVTVNALTSGTALGKIVEISGPEAVSYNELAARISKVAGRTIKYVNLTPDQMRQGMKSSGLPDWQSAALLELDEYYRSGKGVAPDQALREILKQPPRTLDKYLAENAAQFKKA